MTKKKVEPADESTRVIVGREQLENALKRVGSAVAKKTTLPILGSVRLTAIGRNMLLIVATDLEVRAEIQIAAEVSGLGWDICVPSDKLAGAVAAAGSTEIVMTLDQLSGRLVLDCGESCSYELAYLPADDFPAGPDDEDVLLVFPPGVLSRLLTAVGHAVSRDVTRYHLCGVHLRVEEERLEAIATDGARLSIAALSLPPQVESGRFGGPVTIPAKACKLVSALSGSIDFSRSVNSLVFDLPHSRITTNLLEGDYPPFRRVIPTDHQELIIVRRQALIDALGACAVTADDDYRTVSLESYGETLTLSSLGDHGTCTAKLPISGEEAHAELKMRVNGRYLLAALESLAADEVWIRYGVPGAPLVVLPADMEGFEERLEVLMPLRG